MSTAPIDIPIIALPIKTRRLTIREYAEEDWSAVYAYIKNDSYWEYQAGEAPSEEKVRALIQWAVREQNIAPRVNYFLAVTEPILVT